MNVDLIRYALGTEGRCEDIRTLSLESGYAALCAHSTFTFKIKNVSRYLLAQLTTYRLVAVSVQSQRYNGIQPQWIIPESIVNADKGLSYLRACSACYAEFCQYLEAGIPANDARYIMPQGVACNLILTMTARELFDFFVHACCNRSHWEIHELADAMLRLSYKVAPVLFAKAGCACMRGLPCPAGRYSCGHPRKESE